MRVAFPEVSAGICPGWPGPTFETWRETGAGNRYAVITQVPGNWGALEAGQAEQKAAAEADDEVGSTEAWFRGLIGTEDHQQHPKSQRADAPNRL